MNKLYHLSTCTTCQRIIKELDDMLDGFTMQDIKTDKITESQIQEMQSLAGNYESLFSRKAMKYRSMGLGEKNLGEDDYKQLILDEYTFLKRPVFIYDQEIFIGNSKKTVEALKQKLTSS